MPFPIVLFAYNRPYHLQRCLDSLAKNSLLKESELIIYCDGPKTISDDKVKAVRQIATTFSSARSCTVETSSVNQGLAASIIAGVSKVLKTQQAVIVLEDDLLLHPYFLTFMNDALRTYQSDSHIFSVTGHTLPAWRLSLPSQYSWPVYLSPRISSWGWGTWRDRWQKVEWKLDEKEIVHQLEHNSQTVQRLKQGGDDLPVLLSQHLNKKINSWAIRFDWAQARMKKSTLRPIKTLVLNQGLDGSGTHGRGNWLYKDSFDLEFQPTRLPKDISIDSDVWSAFTTAHQTRFYWKVRDFAENLLLKLS